MHRGYGEETCRKETKLEELGVGGKIILKGTLRKYDEVRNPGFLKKVAVHYTVTKLQALNYTLNFITVLEQSCK
jgi:hypothetical protein